MSSFHITINNSPHDVDIAPDTPLLWVLRDNLNMTGTKYGCGAGLCGERIRRSICLVEGARLVVQNTIVDG